MAEWIADIQGVRTVLDTAGDPLPRRSTVQFVDVDPTDDGAKTLIPSHGAALMWSAASGPSNPAAAFLPPRAADNGETTGATENSYSFFVPRAGKLRNLRVNVLGAGCTAAIVYTVRVNGADSALTCSLGAGGTAASDTTHSVAVAANDKISLKAVEGATATGPTLQRATCEYV